jgi:5'-phosphate synthase pdxT subunit
MILLSKQVNELPWEPLALVNMKVRRNAFGRQVDSFEADLSVPVLGDQPFHAVFIRAPIVESVEPDVEVLSILDSRAVAVKQGNILACAFHPELTDDTRFHHYFLDLVRGANGAKNNN